MKFNTKLLAFALLSSTLVLSSNGRADETNHTTLVAAAKATDRAARQIERSVANDTFKSISTKEVASNSAGTQEVVEHETEANDVQQEAIAHEGADAVMPVAKPEIVSEDAPGVREPAAHEEKMESPKAESKPAAPADHHEVSEGVPAEKSLMWLQNGNKRYRTKNLRTDGRSQADRARLTKGQKPHAIVLSCSDSRVPPETVFDQALGEIFVVRTAGESLDNSVIASLEYAVEHLGPKLLVVMGHTSCGAVKAAVTAVEGKSLGSPALDALVADIKPRLPERAPASELSATLETESSANAKGVAADLLKRSTIIRKRVEKGELRIAPALYHLDDGMVKFQ